MKSNAFGIGSINLKGRKTKRLGCGCCTAINYKEEELKKVHLKEIKKAMERGQDGNAADC